MATSRMIRSAGCGGRLRLPHRWGNIHPELLAAEAAFDRPATVLSSSMKDVRQIHCRLPRVDCNSAKIRHELLDLPVLTRFLKC
jgi:hypothetical protein